MCYNLQTSSSTYGNGVLKTGKKYTNCEKCCSQTDKDNRYEIHDGSTMVDGITDLMNPLEEHRF